MKINYPIKYTAMPIRIDEADNWNNKLKNEVNYDGLYYIVSRCYLLNESINYNSNGKSFKTYEVVYPYQFYEFNKFKHVTPEDNFYNNCFTNSKKVSAVFDSYEEAFEYATELNEEEIKKYSSLLPFEEFLKQNDKMKSAFYSTLEEYKLLENQILYYTNNLENMKRKELDDIIVKRNKGIEILPINLYFAIENVNNRNFVAYTITQEQFYKLKELICKEDKIESLNKIIDKKDCLLIHDGKKNITRIASQNTDGVYYIDEYQSLHYGDEYSEITEEELKNIGKNVDIIYTTENFEDVINSYKEYKEIDFSKIQGPVLKKRKF